MSDQIGFSGVDGYECRMSMPFEVRADDHTNEVVIEGYAALFNSDSEPFGTANVIERIAPGAFDEVMDDDVVSLFNHGRDKVLARTKSGTLSLSVDEKGLFYSARASKDISFVRDLEVMIHRGDIDSSSFGFIPNYESVRYDRRDDGVYVRTITQVVRLYDVSPVTFAQYSATSAQLEKRSLSGLRDYKKEQLEKMIKRLRNRARLASI